MNIEDLNNRSKILWTVGKSEIDDTRNYVAKQELNRRITDQSQFDNKALSFARISGEQIADDVRKKKRRWTLILTMDGNESLQMSPELWKVELRKKDVSA